MAKRKVKTIDVVAMEWRDRTYGNSYFSAQVTVNYGLPGSVTLYIPMQYGSGSAYEWAARDLLISEGYLQPIRRGGFARKPDGPLSLICRERDIVLRTTMHDNEKKRDVKNFGGGE